MNKYIILSFALLGLGFFELSGGGAFDPEAAGEAVVQARADREADRDASLAAAGIVVPERDATVAADVPDAQTSSSQPALNLVSFGAAAGLVKEDADAPVAEALPAPAPLSQPSEPPTDIESFAQAVPQDLSIASIALDDRLQGIAFQGNTISSNPQPNAEDADIRTIKGTLVNMRSGPGTDYDVVDQLTQSTQVIVLSDSGNGWVELRPLSGGTTGWIAAFLLSDG